MNLRPFARSWQEPDPDGKHDAARQLWREMSILVIFPGTVHGLDQDWVRQFGNKTYGERRT